MKYPQLAKLVSQYPLIASLGYILEKRVSDIDLDDLTKIGEVFRIPGQPTEAHVAKLQKIAACSSLDDLADLVQSPDAVARVVAFFVPTPEQPAEPEIVPLEETISFNSY